MRNFIYILIIALTTVTGSNAFGQFNPHPCSQVGVDCSASIADGAIFSFQKTNFEYAPPGTSMPIWIAAADKNTRVIDTTHSGPVSLLLIDGPGTLTAGTLTANFTKYHYFTDWKFSDPGVYRFEVNLVGFDKDTVSITVADEVDLCSESPGGDCVNGSGKQIFTFRNGGIIPVDAIFPITVGVYDKATGMIDSSFFGTMELTQFSGPGSMYGTLNMHGKKWVTFTDVKFNTAGTYSVGAKANVVGVTYVPDTFEVIVTEANAVPEVTLNKLSVYPNPFDKDLTFDLTPMDSPELLRIIDAAGKIVQEFRFIGNEKQFVLNASNYKSGLYFYEISDSGTKQMDRGILLKK